MKKNLTLAIAEPCGEDWNSFTPTDTGGFCASCNKNVVDFTHAGETEILDFFKNKPARVCGRFRSDQLKTYLLAPNTIKPGFMLLRAGLLSLLFLLISKPGNTQAPVEKNRTEIVQQPSSNTAVASIQKEMRITGVVTSSEDGSPLPGISVVQRGTAIGTQTDGEGKFELVVDMDKDHVVVFSFIGLTTQETRFNKSINTYTISMDPDETTMGEIIVVGLVGPGRQLDGKNLYTEKPPFFRRVWTKIKTIF